MYCRINNYILPHSRSRDLSLEVLSEVTVGRSAVQSAFRASFCSTPPYRYRLSLGSIQQKNMPVNLNTDPGPRSSPI